MGIPCGFECDINIFHGVEKTVVSSRVVTQRRSQKNGEHRNVIIEGRVSRYGTNPHGNRHITFFLSLWNFRVVSPDFANALKFQWRPKGNAARFICLCLLQVAGATLPRLLRHLVPEAPVDVNKFVEHGAAALRSAPTRAMASPCPQTPNALLSLVRTF